MVNTTTPVWRIIKDTAHSATLNMALDEVLFENMCTQKTYIPTVRLYSFTQAAVTLGRCQPVMNDPELRQLCHQVGMVTRRITGGGVVYHGDDLTYSIIAPISLCSAFASSSQSYAYIHAIVYDVCRDFGVLAHFHAHTSSEGNRTCFTSPVKDDVMINQIKIAGAAQKRSRGVLLHQGSVNFSFIRHEWHSYFDEVSDKFIEYFCQRFGVVRTLDQLRRAEIEQAAQLEKEKYNNKAWILRL